QLRGRLQPVRGGRGIVRVLVQGEGDAGALDRGDRGGHPPSASIPACATCASCCEVTPLTPIAPITSPSTTIGIPPSSGRIPSTPRRAARPPATASSSALV